MSHISPQVRGHSDGRLSHETRAGPRQRIPTLSPPFDTTERGVIVMVDEHSDRPHSDEIAQAAAWVAESIGYPIETRMPKHPMPDPLWEALVDHVHADADGKWHGNELTRDEIASWLEMEAGRG